jgi:ribosomal protein L37E
MVEIISSISNAISLVSRLKKISENVRDAELKNLLADLSLELAEAKMKMASLIGENVDLQNRIRELESVEGDPCPRCRKRGWHIEKSEPDENFGEMGGIRRTYQCSLCGFTEERLIIPE